MLGEGSVEVDYSGAVLSRPNALVIGEALIDEGFKERGSSIARAVGFSTPPSGRQGVSMEQLEQKQEMRALALSSASRGSVDPAQKAFTAPSQSDINVAITKIYPKLGDVTVLYDESTKAVPKLAADIAGISSIIYSNFGEFSKEFVKFRGEEAAGFQNISEKADNLARGILGTLQFVSDLSSKTLSAEGFLNVMNQLAVRLQDIKNNSSGFQQGMSENMLKLGQLMTDVKTDLIAKNASIESMFQESSKTFEQSSKTAETVANNIFSINSEISSINSFMNALSKDFKKETTRYNKLIEDIATTEQEKRNAIAMLDSLKTTYCAQDSSHKMKIEQLEQEKNRQELLLMEVRQKLAAQDLDLRSARDISEKTAAMNKTVDVISTNLSLLGDSFSQMTMNINNLSTKMEGRTITIKKEIIDSLRKIVLDTEGCLRTLTKERIKMDELKKIPSEVATSIQGVSNQLTILTNSINATFAAVQSMNGAGAAPPPPPPPAGYDVAPPFDFEEMRRTIVTAVGNATDPNTIAEAVNRNTTATIHAFETQLNNVMRGINANIAQLSQNNVVRGSSVPNFTYFKPFTLDWYNQVRPNSLIPRETAASLMQKRSRPNKRHGMVAMARNEPDPFVDETFHVKKMKLAPLKRKARNAARARKTTSQAKISSLF